MKGDKMREPDVVFNMDLANAPTSARFCYEAADVLGTELDTTADGEPWTGDLDNHPYLDEIVQECTEQLEHAGYAVRWDAGDVVVWDLRGWTDEEREEFWAEVDG